TEVAVSPGPAFTAQPMDVVVCEDADAMFSVTLETDTDVTLQWQVSEDGTAWTDVAGATGTELLLPAVDRTMSGNMYRACATRGVCGPVCSNAAMLTVNYAP